MRRTPQNRKMPECRGAGESIQDLPNPDSNRGRTECAAICLGLVLLCLAVFGRAAGHGFVNYDDGRFVSENAQVQSGLSLKTAAWAFTNQVESYFMPLSWLSHALDCQLYGLWAGGHHLTSVMIHALNAVLLFLVLLRLTGARWPAALVAALFAVHPLHVESVVWASERKDVLSTLFWCLTLLAYTHYAARPMLRRYLAVTGFFILALMSKPMVVTLPALLLLLDFWPLGRLRDGASNQPLSRTAARLVLEKIPLFAAAAAVGLATFLLQGKGHAVLNVEDRSLPLRLANAAVSYAFFLVKAVFPTGLSVVYPWPVGGFPAWQVAGAVVLLGAFSAAAILTVRTRPWLLVGWLWYLGLMAPVMQVMQRHAFSYARADRYTYCALIGVAIIVVWTARDLAARLDSTANRGDLPKGGGAARTTFAVLGGVAVTVYAVVSFVQVGHWKDSVSLFEHALAVTSDNFPAQVSLGRALQNQGQFKEAESHFRRALDLRPKDGAVLNNLGVVIQAQGRLGDAKTLFEKALRQNPQDADALANLGAVLNAQGKSAEAELQLRKALKANPGHLLSLTNLSAVLLAQGRANEAEDIARKALERAPDHADAQYSLGVILQSQARYAESEALFRSVLESNPDHVSALGNLGAALLSQKRYEEAKAPLARALALKPDHLNALVNLGMACQALGDCAGAKAQFLRVLEFKPDTVAVLNGLAWMCATSADEACRDGKKAVECAQRVLALAGTQPAETQARLMDVLAAAYARDGQYDKAVEAAQKAVDLIQGAAAVPEERMREMIGAFERRKDLYRNKTAYTEEAGRPAQ